MNNWFVFTVRLVVLAVTVFTAACATGGRAVPRPFPGAAVPPTAPAPEIAGGIPGATVPPAVLGTALALRGSPYRNGGSDPSGFDCSGFVQWVFAQNATALPREVREQYRVGDEVEHDAVQPGDLVFFETVSRGASHVGIALGGGAFVHAPSSRGVVRVERYDSTYWAQRWVGARRVMVDAVAPLP